MAEQVPRDISPEVVDLAWEAALGSNRAFDALQEAEANITKVQEVEQLAIAGVDISGEAFEALEQERTNAQANYSLLTDMAAPVMLLPNSPFTHNTAEVTAPTVEVEVPEDLENLPTDYRELVVARYAEKLGAVARQIKNGTLPENYQLPELSTFVERVVALAPTHEVMAQKNWQPEVVFVPKGLSLEQWDTLLTGHELGNDSKSNGAYRTWTDYEVVDPKPASEADASLWGVAVISATGRPALVKVSKDGKNGSNAKQAIKTLSELPSVTDTSSAEAVIKQVSPTEEQYFALQLARMERGEKPVDAETWTIGKEDIKVGRALGSLFFRFNPFGRRVGSYWSGRGDSSGGGGVRPSVGDEDLVLNS